MPARAPSRDDRALVEDLRRVVSGEVRFDAMTRVLYSTDASIYQIEPIGVVLPRTAEDVAAVVETAGRHGVPVLPRGGGTSLAGQTVGHAVVIDFSKYMRDLLEVNAEEGMGPRPARHHPGRAEPEARAHRHDVRPGPQHQQPRQRRRRDRQQLLRRTLHRLGQDGGQRIRAYRRAIQRRLRHPGAGNARAGRGNACGATPWRAASTAASRR